MGVANEGHKRTVGVQMAVNLVWRLYFGEVFDFLAQNLFSNAFLVVLVGVDVDFKGQRDELGDGPRDLVGCGCIKRCGWHLANSELCEEGALGLGWRVMGTGLGCSTCIRILGWV